MQRGKGSSVTRKEVAAPDDIPIGICVRLQFLWSPSNVVIQVNGALRLISDCLWYWCPRGDD